MLSAEIFPKEQIVFTFPLVSWISSEPVNLNYSLRYKGCIFIVLQVTFYNLLVAVKKFSTIEAEAAFNFCVCNIIIFPSLFCHNTPNILTNQGLWLL